MDNNTLPQGTSLKFVFTVSELAERWAVSDESIRRLIRERRLRPLQKFRPFRISMDEVRRYETYDEAEEKRRAFLALRRPNH